MCTSDDWQKQGGGTWVCLSLLEGAAHMQEHLQPGPIPSQVALHRKRALRMPPASSSVPAAMAKMCQDILTAAGPPSGRALLNF